MKLHSLFEAPGQPVNFAELVAQALEHAGWHEGVNPNPTGATFYRTQTKEGYVQFSVPVVNSSSGGDANGQVSSQLFNQTITPLFRQARAQGVEFTQPVGASGSGFQTDRVHGTVMQFFIGQARQ